jgi:hypothetical protein
MMGEGSGLSHGPIFPSEVMRWGAALSSPRELTCIIYRSRLVLRARVRRRAIVTFTVKRYPGQVRGFIFISNAKLLPKAYECDRRQSRAY